MPAGLLEGSADRIRWNAVADTEVAIVGAGVVGLAIAARLAPHHSVVVVERNPRPGMETSSRNSEVIHAGMYYPTASLKARLCVAGNRQLYEICARKGVPHARVTKIITARTPEELPPLEQIHARGAANGVELRMLTAAEVRALEPNVPSAGALFSPNTGIVSAHGLMDHFAHAAREAGAVIQPRAELVELARNDGEWQLTLRSGGEADSVTAERVVNAAGLDADTVAALAGVDVDEAGYRQHYCKGSYFAVSAARSRLVSRLVYPVPGHVSLGVHAVIGLEGRLRFGPDAEYLPDRRQDYAVDEAKRPTFGAAVRQLVPAIQDDDLSPDISGIRAKLQGPGEGFRDFVIADESARGHPGLVNLIGIDSPGLTSSPAIAEHVARMIEGS
ncbi:MAG: NAD(P)/FAD-dependent oxidoreductase [Acidobacteria bacterium]|nr:MAG: NAD(P)/FAD-dependent oxidoreductase [Acidobacteriota bacterium]